MERTTLTLHTQPNVPLEAPGIRPDALAGLSEREIERLPVWHGNREVPLGEFFQVRGSGSEELRIVGDLGRVKELGAGMEAGRLVIEGDAGMHTGAGMRGGHLWVEGSVDDWAGAEMRGGILEVHGDAGDHLASAYVGSTRGMRGGTVLVHGSAGAQAAARMRRGTIAVRGDVGEYAAAYMVAGSLLVFGDLGPRPAPGMKRGSILVGGTAELLPTFRFACVYRPDFLALYLRRLSELDFPVDERFHNASYQRFNGDFTGLGKGEILIWRK